MTSNLSKADQLRDYLLGRLSESEQKRLERRLLLEDRLFQMEETLAQGSLERTALDDELAGASDEEVEERERAVRAELFDAYARGELGIEDRQWVGQLAESSEPDRERLAFARTLAGEAEATPANNRWIWHSAAGIAATVALVFGLFAVIPRIGRIHVAPSNLQTALSTAVGSASVRPETAVAEVYWANARDGEIPAIALPPQVSKQIFRLHLPAAADRHSRFQVTLLGPGGRSIGAPREIGKDPDQTLRLEETVAAWTAGIYTFQVSYPGKDGKWMELGAPQVEVVGR